MRTIQYGEPTKTPFIKDENSQYTLLKNMAEVLQEGQVHQIMSHVVCSL